MEPDEQVDRAALRRLWSEDEWTYAPPVWDVFSLLHMPRGSKRWINVELTARMLNGRAYWDRWLTDECSGEIPWK